MLGVYFIEAGLLLIAAPWTPWWERNYFADVVPWLRGIMEMPAAPATVISAGVITVLAGLRELRDAMARRLAGRSSGSAGR